MNVVIVGCGVASITAARTLKEKSPQTEVSIYSDENYLYYPRPYLYNILSGQFQPEDIVAFPQQWYDDRGIRVDLGKKASKIDTDRKDLLFEDGSKAGYDKLLLVNGAHPFVPPIKGVDKKGVFSLRSLKDAITIRDYAEKTPKTIVIGGGLLGLEFAASLRRLGQEVDAIEIFPRLLPRQLDQDGATIFQQRIETFGIKFELGVKTTEVLGGEKVSGILLDNGKSISGDLVLFSAGIRSNVKLAVDSGIQVNRGVVVDHFLRTSADDVYAAGDVAEFEGKVYGIIPAAEEQARLAALNILDTGKRVYKGTVPSNTLKIVGIDLTSMGIVDPTEPKYEEVKKNMVEKGVYKKIVLEQGRIVGAIVLGDTRGVAAIRQLMDLGTDVSKYKDSVLEDNFDFRKILKSPQ